MVTSLSNPGYEMENWANIFNIWQDTIVWSNAELFVGFWNE